MPTVTPPVLVLALPLSQSQVPVQPVLRVDETCAEPGRERRHGRVGADEPGQEAVGPCRAAVGAAVRLGRRQLLRLLLALRLLAVQLLLLGLGDPGLARRGAAAGTGAATASSAAALAAYSSSAGSRAAAASATSLGRSLTV